MPRVFIPPTLRSATNGVEETDASGSNVREVLEDLDRQFPGILDQLCEDGSVRSDISVVINGDVATMGMLQKVPAEAELHFLPMVAGG